MVRFSAPFLLLDAPDDLLRFLGAAALVGAVLVLWWGILRQLR
ncbi:MAG: hypothetical protein ACUVTQ_07465 [Desulfotomaculales bacterium]